MRKDTLFVGMDVHAQTISLAVAEENGQVRSVGVISNRMESIRKRIGKLSQGKRLRCCYEAGPCGYVLYWQLAKLGVECEVVAPSLIPVKPGDRVKTDKRDAMKLARCYRSGDLTPVWIPDAAQESVRDLVRAREAAKQDQLRARHRLKKFLLRRGVLAPEGMRAWGHRYMRWVKALHFERAAQEATYLDYLHEVEHMADRVQRLEQSIDEVIPTMPVQMKALVEALQALRGVRKLTAVSVVTELGSFSRFKKAPQLMGYSGMVSSEYSSAQQIHRGRITKTGNAHLRRVLVESAWSYRYRPAIGPDLGKRQEGLSEKVKEIAWKAQHRLHQRYRKLSGKGKVKGRVVVAVARELLGFMWSIGVEVENSLQESRRKISA